MNKNNFLVLNSRTIYGIQERKLVFLMKITDTSIVAKTSQGILAIHRITLTGEV